MALDLTALQTLAETCAPAVAPATLLAIGQAESGSDPLAIGVNGSTPRRLTFPTPAAAAAAARRLIAAGGDIDLGLGQINMRNLRRLGLSVEAAFDPCRNLAASAQVLAENYLRTPPSAGNQQMRLRTALSYYNTGRPDRGFANGYVARVSAAAAHIVPALAPPAAPAAAAPTPPPAGRAATPAWAVFGGMTAAPFVFTLANGATP